MLRCLKFQIVGWSSDLDRQILGQISIKIRLPKLQDPSQTTKNTNKDTTEKELGENSGKTQTRETTNKIQNHSALFLRSCFIALVFVVSLHFLAQHHCNLFSFWIPLCSTSKARFEGNRVTPPGDFPLHPLFFLTFATANLPRFASTHRTQHDPMLTAQNWTDALWKQSNRKVQLQSCNKCFWIIFFLKPFLAGWLHQTDFFTVCPKTFCFTKMKTWFNGIYIYELQYIPILNLLLQQVAVTKKFENCKINFKSSSLIPDSWHPLVAFMSLKHANPNSFNPIHQHPTCCQLRKNQFMPGNRKSTMLWTLWFSWEGRCCKGVFSLELPRVLKLTNKKCNGKIESTAQKPKI